MQRPANALPWDGPVLVAGVGNPWIGDLDFGPQFARRYADAGWPEGVLLEEAAVAAQLMVHRLRELRPRRVIFVAAFPRGDPPATVRHYRLEGPLPDEEEVHRRLGESATGVIDLDHVLAVTRWLGDLPPDAEVIEVEPASCGFGGFSAEIAPCWEQVLALLRRCLGDAGGRPPSAR